MKGCKKRGWGNYFPKWQINLDSPLNMTDVCIYVLQLGYPFLMIHSVHMNYWIMSIGYSSSHPWWVVWELVHYIYGPHWVNDAKSSHLLFLHVQGMLGCVSHLQSCLPFKLAIPMSIVLYLSYLFTPSTCVYFVSMMGATSLPSFDGSLPVGANTLSKK